MYCVNMLQLIMHMTKSIDWPKYFYLFFKLFQTFMTLFFPTIYVYNKVKNGVVNVIIIT